MRICLLVLVCIVAMPSRADGVPDPAKQDIFEAGVGGYITYRIPGVVVTPRGTVMAYCEARKDNAGDWADIHIVGRRSGDRGQTWEPMRELATPPKDAAPNPVAVARKMKISGTTLNNPVMIVDPVNGVIHFLYCVNYGRCFYTHSDDDGRTFADPVEITGTFEKFRPQYDWKVIATGPGHGIRLTTSGRLVVPVWMSTSTGRSAHHPSCVATIFSDDAGKIWQASQIVMDTSSTFPDPNETTAAELSDGKVMLNTRTESHKHRRAFEISADGSSNWTAPAFDESLPDPICFASLVRVPHPDASHPVGLAFSNCANRDTAKNAMLARVKLTVRLSLDDGKTWSPGRVLEAGMAGYSDLAASEDGTLYCLYERDRLEKSPGTTKALCFASIRPEWIVAGK